MWIVIRGGGDLASGVAMRLYRAGLRVLITELAQPLVVRRLVSFAEAVYEGQAQVEGVTGQRVDDLDQAQEAAQRGKIPVLVDAQGKTIDELCYHAAGRLAIVDARMLKQPPERSDIHSAFVVGLGPGFTAGQDCHAVIETNRGHLLGRVIWQGNTTDDTGIPESVAGHGADRVLRAPAAGLLKGYAAIGEHVHTGQVLAEVAGQLVYAPFDGVLRGLLRSGLAVGDGLKIGDVDPRNDPQYCYLISDKSLSIGGGVLEAIFSQAHLRPYLWS